MSYVSTTVITLEDAEARAGIYRLLARLWLQEVDRETLQQLQRPPLQDSFLEAGGLLPSDESDDLVIERLAISYCQLFVGPANHLPPFQSVWQAGQLQGDAATEMQKTIDIVGYDVTSLPSGTMLDHLGVQLDVMGHVLEEISHWPADKDGSDQVWELANSFFATHLLWPNELLTSAAKLADSKFYRSVVNITRDFLRSELQK